MWGGPGPDPGGTKGGGPSTGPPSNQELIDLKDQFEQQQVLIAQLKEMLRKTEQTTVTQEKVEEYANTLTRMSARAKKSKLKREGAADGKTEVVTVTTTKTTTLETPASEKIMLLRQQLEENKLKLAQRGKFQKGIEESVTQLKAQLDDSQQLISQTPLNLSLNESRTENYSINSSPEELFNLLVNRDRRVAELIAKVQKLEANVLDLQENVKEKDSVIDARTKAITLMSESLSKKGKTTLDALDDTKEQMRKMQENFVTLEMEMKNEKQQLLVEVEQKNNEIELIRASYIALENKYVELQHEIEVSKGATISGAMAVSDSADLHSQIATLNNRIIELEKLNVELQTKSPSSLPENEQKLMAELEEKNKEIDRLQEVNNALEQDCNKLHCEIESLNNCMERYKDVGPDASNNEDLLNKIETLNNRIVELEGLNSELSKPSGVASRDSPQRSSKKGKKGQKQNTKAKENVDTSETKIVELQSIIDNTKAECEKHRDKISEYELTIHELQLTIEELKAKQETVKPVLETKPVAESEEIAKLKKQLDESNKNTIKIKAQHKSKIKELNKKIDELKKGSGNSAEILRLQSENAKLSERIDILEEEKARLGLDANLASSVKDFAASERLKELELKVLELSELLDTKNQSIATLEEQIKTYQTEVESLNERFEKLTQLENAQVVSQITSIHFEEQLDKVEMEKKELIQEKEDMMREKEELLEKIENLMKDKQEISGKLDSYIQENMELIDKLEKLSAEKVSSAESIEIVEGLTQQEKLELEAYQKSLEITSENIKNSDENLEQHPELNESVNQLTEETSDLLRKIELFTEERREVMEKMEALTAENNQLNLKIQEIENNRDILADTYEQIQNEKENIEVKLEEQKEKIKGLEINIDELTKENEILKEKVGGQEIKHGSEVEEMVKLETVGPLTAGNEEKTVELQKQIDEYKSLVEIQKQEIQELKLELLSQKDLSLANNELHEKITTLQTQYEALLSENEKLNKAVKETSEIVHEKDTIESELIATKKRISEFDEKLTNNLNEIENYRSIIEENKDELISSANLITDLQSKLSEKQNEIAHYESEILHLNSVIAELNSAVSHLENENRQNNDNNATMELMSNQLQELKALLNENIKQIEDYETELQQNSDTIVHLNTQLKGLNNQMLEMEHELECKDDEIKKLTKERDNKETMIAKLQEELKQKDEKFHQVCDSLKEKYLSLQSQIEQNAGSLDSIKNPLSKIQELENKNKEQLDKMKKIAANLKKKTAAYQELDEKYKEKTEKWETEEKEKLQLQEVIQTKETKIQSLLEQLNEMEKEFGNLQNTLVLKNKEFDSVTKDIAQLKIDVVELQNLKQQYELQLNALTTESEMHRYDESNKLNVEINEKNEIIRNLTEQLETIHYSSETNSNALHAKIQELELFIETQEAELTKNKEKVNKLEEGLSTVEERRLSLERQAVELGAQLREKSNSYEEISQTEDMLEQRLEALMIHDEKIQRHLQEATKENQELTERNQYLAEENGQLKHKLSAATERNIDAVTNLEKQTDLQNENIRLSEIIANLEIESKRLHVEFEKKLHDKKNEVETMEIELQGQLVQLDNERKTLAVQCEHLRDQINEYSENQELLKEEIEQYKQKLEQQQVDFDAHIAEFQRVTDENKKNLGIIEQLTSQLAGISDMGNASNTIKQLEKLLEEKNSEIENYQKQNMQLQMQGAFSQNQPFDIFGQSPQSTVNSLQSDLQKATEELQLTKQQLLNFEHSNSELKILNSELLEKITVFEKQSTESKITEKPQQSAQEQSVSTFVWPGEPSNDPFDFVIDPVVSQPASVEPPIQAVVETQLQAQTTSNKTARENTKEELLNKIKTLEFMLYNVENEKEDILSLCQELTNEVAKLIYEKQNTEPAQQPSSQPPIEEQIIPVQEATVTQEDLKQLQNLEFEKTKPCKDVTDSSNLQPVSEDVLQPKTAYLCYQLEAQPGPSSNITQQQGFQHIQVTPIESQIISEQEAKITDVDLKQLHNVEFEKTKDVQDVVDHTKPQPVLEDVMECKRTYLCYKPEKQTQEAAGHQASINLDAFDENDDGWGYGPEEAKLEEDYRRRTGDPPMNQNLNLHIEELEEKVRVLEVERERHLEEIKQAQIKSGKLIKKLKEFKALNEKLTSDLRKSSDFGGLDDAIQDELQSQVARLEKRVKESSAELEKEKAERNNLMKKLDMLQAANERMVDMKEKQDVEVLSWQRQNRELKTKLEQFEWGDDGFDSPKHAKVEQQGKVQDTNVNVQSYEKKIQDLSDTIKELTLDNEELQVMLEEQRTLRINAEKAKSVEPMAENMKTEAEYLTIVAERNTLNNQLTSSVEEKKNLQEQLNNLIKSNGELQQNLQHLTEEKSLLENKITENNMTTQELTVQLENLIQTSQTTQNNELQEAAGKIMSLEQENLELNNRLHTLETTAQQLQMETSSLSELKDSISVLNQEKAELFNALQEKNVLIENLNESIAKLSQEITELKEKLNQSQNLTDENKTFLEKLQLKDNELVEIQSKLDAALEERSALSESLQQLAEEWSQRVDQRGSDVAESWKLHLESRESEFIQVEQQLRKEINEFEEKCNALVNENNELRKNVDAEIRNEVDRISALQQQINDRQHYINDLTRVVQEHQTEIEQQRQKLTEYDGVTLQLNTQIQEKDLKITEMEALVSTLQLEIQQKSKTVEDLQKKLQEFELIRQQLDGNQQASAKLQSELSEKQNMIQEYVGKLDNADIELNQYKEAHSLMQQQLQDKDDYIYELTNKLKELEIQKTNEADSNIQLLHQQITDLQLQLQEKHMQVEALNHQIYNYQQFSTNIETKDAEIRKLTADSEKVNLLLQEKQIQIETLTQELHNYQRLNETMESKEIENNQLNVEINNLKLLLSEKEKEYAYNLAATTQDSESVFTEKAQELDAMKRRQANAENHYEELLIAKDADMENLRLQLQEQIQRSEALMKDYQEHEDTLDDFKTQLDIKVQECEELQNKVEEQNVLHNEENKQLGELRQIIEDQVLKIEALKHELYDKSKDYDSLIAELDIRKPSRFDPDSPPAQEHQEQFVTQATRRETIPTTHDSPDDSALEPVSHAELDLALYMLHQRDVRCEELTVELMQLLEERDTLQLKLSNAIREKEELRSRFVSPSPTPENPETDVAKPTGSPTGTLPKSKASAIVLGATGTELATEATESLQDVKDTNRLANKLSELKSIGYRRDKTLLDEQEQRRLQQLSLMQQHRDVGAMLPPEAAARLVQEASYTLSRDVQSPSKVLLNWLWGRSTPKVNNI